MMLFRTEPLSPRLSAILLILTFSGCDTSDAERSALSQTRSAPTTDRQVFDDQAECETSQDSEFCELGMDSYYWSPFQSLASKSFDDLPMFDIQDDESGNRYAAIRDFRELEDGTVLEDRNEVGTVSRSPMTADDYARLSEGKEAPLPTPEKSPISPSLSSLISETEGGALISVHARARGPEGLEPLQRLRNRAVAEGLIETLSDAQAFEDQALAQKREAIADYFDTLIPDVEALGATVTYQCKHGACFDIEATGDAIKLLATLDEIESLDRTHVLEEASNDVNGVGGLEHVYQTKPFMDHPSVYDGDSAGSVIVAVMEYDKFLDDHPAFKEGTGSTSRIIEKLECTSSACTAVSGWTGQTNSHATSSAGLLFGDLTDGQDSGVTGSTDRRRRSSAGREARGYMYHLASSTTSTYRTALDDMAGQSPRPVIVSNSIPSVSADPTCDGMDSLSGDVDELLFENSTLMFVAAGNSGGTSTDCRVWSPGSAIGAFTVAGWGSQTTYTDLCDMRDAAINSNSSWGGNGSEGRGRTIIDIAGSYWHALAPLSNYGYGTRNGTSIATPAVAGTAVAFRDMYRVEHGTWLDDPGALFAWMLNMGDRDTTGVHIVEEFDKRFGAGRENLRMLNTEGLDAPYGIVNLELCIDDGEQYVYDLGTLSTDVDSIRATLYWYDQGFRDGGALDDIDLALYGDGVALRNSNDRSDNKERVFYKDIGGKDTEIRIYGYDVTSDDMGCGSNSARVYLTLFYEDDDRDDSNGPTWNGSTCEGVDTW